MNEKITHEIRVIETEDGFRIELKGDKEELRSLIFGGGAANVHQFFHHRGFGRQFLHNHGFGQHHHQPFGEEKHKPHGGRKRHRYDLGPWWDENATSENA